VRMGGDTKGTREAAEENAMLALHADFTSTGVPRERRRSAFRLRGFPIVIRPHDRIEDGVRVVARIAG
jgi:hypothetical protein